MKESMLSIREFAARAGVSVHTLRYYERAGLIPRAERAPSGYRRYPAEAARHVRLVRMLRSLGFGIRELRAIAGVLDRRFPHPAMRARLRAKRDEVARTLGDLTRAWRLLDALQRCRCRGDCVLVVRLVREPDVRPAGARRSPKRNRGSARGKEQGG